MDGNYALRITKQQQALKGILRTLNSVRERYCEHLCAKQTTHTMPLSMPAPVVRLEKLQQAQGQITEAVSGVNSLHSCLGISVVAFCTAAAFRALPDSSSNQALQTALAPLDSIVQTKIWSTEEREHLFRLCFEILGTFGNEFAHLIAEVQENFTEETANL